MILVYIYIYIYIWREREREIVDRKILTRCGKISVKVDKPEIQTTDLHLFVG